MALGDEFYRLNESLQKKASEVIENVLKKQTDKVYRELEKNTPVSTGGLKSSLRTTKIESKDRVGYRIEYYGYDNEGRAYSVIANSLNRGYIGFHDKFIEGKHFIDKAISTLKGTDDLINAEWREAVIEISAKKE